MTDSLDAPAKRRQIHETMCRIAQEGGIAASRIDVPFLVDVVNELEQAQLSIEQALVLGAYLVGVARGAASEQAVSN